MTNKIIRIGTRESQLAVWQATQVKSLLERYGFPSELVYIKSEGDLDLKTPLYEMGVQGIFTRSLDAALLSDKIDVAVHSMKDVPTQLPKGIIQAAVLKRGPVNDLLVFKTDDHFLHDENYVANIATSSLRRKAQWLNRYPHHQIHNLRGNVNTRLRKLHEENWDAAIFAQAGLERIDLRPENSQVIDWMLPAPAQGAIMVVCRSDDEYTYKACRHFNDEMTALCAKIERDFLRTLMGGCSTPISALAVVKDNHISFKGNILSLDGSQKKEVEKIAVISDAGDLGNLAGKELLVSGGRKILEEIQHAVK
ncbi:hydroxymethylbilane synthase [Terrimonas pollutisoli]|uniref:hydroxymethylbilane synthase n=1 Tax=Terrimonas pollutisoli TaxID=3034147 RepID=UPI0023EC9A05|nr:hydroxymethylbilane synthase [Terrimonas sp. H1YJ31]